MQLVVDASVLVDILLQDRQRHSTGVELVEFVKRNGVELLLPYHAILEMKCAIQNERNERGCNSILSTLFSEADPLKFTPIPIDELFFRDYFISNVPYIKAGDLIYILVAKKHSCPLVTEDKKQRKIAEAVGVFAYSVNGFLTEQLNRPAPFEQVSHCP